MSDGNHRGIHWSEGMLILPHHFQAQDAHWSGRQALARQSSRPYAYGLRRLRIQPEALANQEFRVTELTALTRAGTLLTLPGNTTLPSLSLVAGAAADTDTVGEVTRQGSFFVQLALPHGHQPQAGDDHCRFRVAEVEWRDVDREDSYETLEVQTFHARLIVTSSIAAPEGAEALPLARLTRSTEAGGGLVLDRTYIPPLLACDAWPILEEDILQAVKARVQSAARALADKLKAQGGLEAANQPAVRRNLHWLQTLNGGVTTLTQVAAARGLPPFEAYLELCRLVGQLAIFRPEMTAPDADELPEYDHDDLGRIFHQAALALTLPDDRPSKVRRLDLRWNDAGDFFEVKLPGEVSRGRTQLFVGMRTDLKPDTLDRFIGENYLNWKLGAAAQIAEITNGGLPGVDLHRLAGVHADLPAADDLHYYALEQQGDYWQRAEEAGTLALHLVPQFMQAKPHRGAHDAWVHNGRDPSRSRQIEFFLFAVQR